MNQLHHRIPFRLVQRQPIGNMPPRDHQAVPRRHRIGIGDAERQFVLQKHPAADLQPAEHTARLAAGVAGLQSVVSVSRLAALQRKQRDCRLLMASEPPWFLGMMGAAFRARWSWIC